jgi:glucose/arabinose dehydrogenase
LFDTEGYLWISSGDRQKFTPAQDMQANLGKALRLREDAHFRRQSLVHYFDENPLVDDEGVYGQIWSLGSPQRARPRASDSTVSSGKSKWGRRAATS